MSYEVICPYCFQEMRDDEVLFRSEKVSQEEDYPLPAGYHDRADFQTRYNGSDKDEILGKLDEWEFFEETDDEEYERFWKGFDRTTEYNPADDTLVIKAYRRRVIDPSSEEHQQYLKRQPNGTWFLYDDDGMASQIELQTNEKCSRRVCRYCRNPLPDNYGKNKAKFAVVIGITGAGKTIYLSQMLRGMRSYAAKVGVSAVVSNSNVRSFLEKNSVAAKKRLPGSTPVTRFQQPLCYEMTREGAGKERITETFVLYDVAGEVFKDNELVKKFAPFIEHADGVIVLIDPMQFEVISGTSAQNDRLDEPSTVLETIHHIISHGKDNTKCEIPFAVCISKVDTEDVQRVLNDRLSALLRDDVHGIPDESGLYLPVFNAKEYNPIAQELNDFIQTNEIVLAQQMQANYASYAYFAFTALGCDVAEGVSGNGEKYNYPMGPVLPKRIEEPILWLFHQMGYIDRNEELFSPVRQKKYCPVCNSEKVHELSEEEGRVTSGFWIFKKEEHYNRQCEQCGHRWIEDMV